MVFDKKLAVNLIEGPLYMSYFSHDAFKISFVLSLITLCLGVDLFTLAFL